MPDMTATDNAEALMSKQMRALLVAYIDDSIAWLNNPLGILDLARGRKIVRAQVTFLRLYLATVDGRRLLANNDGGLS